MYYNAKGNRNKKYWLCNNSAEEQKHKRMRQKKQTMYHQANVTKVENGLYIYMYLYIIYVCIHIYIDGRNRELLKLSGFEILDEAFAILHKERLQGISIK